MLRLKPRKEQDRTTVTTAAMLRKREVADFEWAVRKRYWGQHFWARGYFCATTGTVTDEMIKAYIGNHTAHDSDSDEFEIEN